MDSYGIVSIIPPILAIVLAWWTRQAIISLFIGILTGATILANYNPFMGFLNTFTDFIVASLTDSWNASVIIFLLALGGMIGIMGKAGGTKAIGDYFARKAKTVKKASIATWIMGIVVFIDDYVNMLIVGTTMRPITDELNISREKLSYIMDSTGSPMSSMALISSWVAFELGLIEAGFQQVGIELAVYPSFLRSIPYRFYSIFALILVFIIISQSKDFGPMYKAEVRARKTGKVLRDGAKPMISKELTEMEDIDETGLSAFQTLGLILSVVIFAIFGIWFDGGGLAGASLTTALTTGDSGTALLWASFISSILTGLFVFFQSSLDTSEVLDSWIDGAKAMLFACVILILVWSIAAVTGELGTANFIVEHAKGVIAPWLIPTLVFFISFIIAFSTGSSWTAQAIVMPIAIPLAYSIGAPLFISIGAVLTGGAGGGHCSPLSDCTILASTGAGADHMDHVNTQLPYALLAAAVAIIFGYIPAALGVPAYILIPLGIFVMYLFVKFVGKSVKEEDLENIRVEDIEDSGFGL